MTASVTAALATAGVTALFRSFRQGAPCPTPGFHDRGWSALLRAPIFTRAANTPREVPPLIRQAEAAQAAGRWAILVVAYEAAPALDPALETRPIGCVPGDFPLAWLAVFDAAEPLPPPGLDEGAAPGESFGGPWTSTVPDATYQDGVARVRELLRQGEAYQVNYTAPFVSSFNGGARASLRRFLALGTAFEPGWAAWIDMGGWRIECLSPELFFLLEHMPGGDRLVRARPMKGTEPRIPGQDCGLAACPKNRAENVMIVDLLRNDLGRVALPGGVRVPRLFEVEAYGGLWQMTSTVEADLRPELGLAEVLAALFPCGSVTGAPKVRAMQIIRELEPAPRGVYCGAIGLLAPGGRAAFCVPIRTIVTRVGGDRPESRFGAGGGVTFDSTPEGELAERAAKAAFLARPAPDFRLIEALRLEDGRLDLLEPHLDRLAASAQALGFALDRGAARRALLGEAAGRPSGVYKLRLELGRDGHIVLDAAPLDAMGAFGNRPLRLALAAAPVDSRDPRLAHKTTRREVYDRALAEAKARDSATDEVILWNEHGEVCEASRANLAIHVDGALRTPPLTAGCLPGIMRRKLLETGRVVERAITVDELRRAGEIVLFNAVRGVMRGRLTFAE